MSDNDQKSEECKRKPPRENVVRAVMFAIVASILGSVIFSLMQGSTKNIAAQNVFESSVNNNWQAQTQSHVVTRTVSYAKNENTIPALFRALALLLFCAGYFGDEWRSGICRNTTVDYEMQDFPMDYIGWLLFTLQACMVKDIVLFSALGVGAICCVSRNLTKERELHHDENATSRVDDWLCENAIWMTWLILAMVLPLSATILSGALLVVALLIFFTKTINWTEGQVYSRVTLIAMSTFFPLPLLIIGCLT